jgi:predicted RNA-binding Zn ribbon-like protein
VSCIETLHYPVIGEPAVLEFANTYYRDGDETVDFLASPKLVEGWFLASPTAVLFGRPRRWTTNSQIQLAGVRNATRDVLDALIDGRVADPKSVDVLNTAAASTFAVPELHWDHIEGPTLSWRASHNRTIEALLNELALATFELLTGPEAVNVRRCASEDCWMLFLKDHPRRRWCHNSCGHRNRQASYYRRTHRQNDNEAV